LGKDFSQLTQLVKQVSLKVVQDGGIVRSIQNHGIRTLPYRFKAKYPDKMGNRYYKKGRFLSVFYDSNPTTQKQVEAILKLDEQVIRNTHLKAVDILERVNVAKNQKNPFVQRVLAHENETSIPVAPV
jgi:ribosomal protein S6